MTAEASDALREWLIDQVALYLGTDRAEIDTSVTLTRYGLDSVYAFVLCGDIEERFNITVEPTVAWDYPTIDALAEYVGRFAGEPA
jgi:acyl carrier protein